MNRFEKYFYSSVDFPLYHYTGIGSLLGMANSHSLWATSISYLNDSKEMIHACEVFEDVLMPRLVFKEYSEREIDFLNQLSRYMKTISNVSHTLFVFSLSEESSALSQWRSYTPHGKGVCLEFSPEKVSLIALNNGFKIARCIYDYNEQREVIGGLIDELIVNFNHDYEFIDTTKRHPEQCYYDFINKHTNQIYQLLAIIKHEAFREEKEWRLISSYRPLFTDPKLKFREGSSMLAPYVEVDLLEKPFFNSVTLGPSQHENLSFSSLSMFVTNQRLCGCIKNSQIPYREW